MLRQSSIFIIATIVGASAVAGASILDSVSSSCKDALQAVLVSPQASCLNVGTLASNAITTNKSIPDIANTWLTGLCASGSCSNSSIAAVVQNVTTGCSDDLNKFGITGAGLTPSVILDYAQRFYPTVRQIACLKDDGANKLCVPETLTALQSIIGTLGKDDLDLTTLLSDVKTLANSDYKNIACTACIKQAYTVGSKVFPFPDLLADAQGPIADTCGASFVDGQNVTGVSDTARSGQFSAVVQNSGAVLFKAIGMAGTAFATDEDIKQTAHLGLPVGAE